MGADPDRANTGAAATVGDTEGLVQVEVRNVGAESTRPGQADHGVEVGAIQVHLATSIVNGSTDFGHCFFEHTMSARVRDHQCSQIGALVGDLGPKVIHVYVAGIVAGHHHNPHAGHHRAGGIGAVSR